jgi:hypothetical protein
MLLVVALLQSLSKPWAMDNLIERLLSCCDARRYRGLATFPLALALKLRLNNLFKNA